MRSQIHFVVLLTATAVIGVVSYVSGSSQSGQPLPENRRAYYNHEFGFSLDLPFFAPACDVTQSNQDTGITFFLDEGISDCNIDWNDRRYVSYHEHYNAADFSSAGDMLEKLCDGEILPTDATLFPELLPVMPMMCRVVRGDLVRYEFAGLSGGDLHTHHAAFQTLKHGEVDVRYGEVFLRDLGVFRATISTLRRHEPDPTDVRGTGWSAIHSRILKEQQ